MRFDNIIWRDEIIEKLAVKHAVEKWELEEVLGSSPRIRFRERKQYERK